MNSLTATAIRLAPKLRLKTLHLPHVSCAKLLIDRGPPLEKIVAADQELAEAREEIRKTLGVDIQLIK